MDKTCYEKAAIMLDCKVDDIPPKIYGRLNRIESYMKKFDKESSLRSSQLIASIIEDYYGEKNRQK